jgi:spermidine synthase
MTLESATPEPIWFEDDDTRAILVDTAALPDGGQLRLMRRDGEFAIMYGREQLMGSWDSASEQGLARMVCDRLALPDVRLLIGGLGMGFTLAAALAATTPAASIRVAELVPEVAAWAAGPLAHLFESRLDDPRVSLEIADVHDVIVRNPAAFDGILLDVDNGPDGLIDLLNDRLYCNWGLRAARDALRPGGILAVWSSYPDRDFFDRLEDAGFAVEEFDLAANDYADAPRHVIWLARKR